MIAEVMSPTVSTHAHAWVVPVLLVALVLLFVSAAIIGPISRAEKMDEDHVD